MPTLTLPILAALALLIGTTLTTIARVRENRRNPAPKPEQALNGVGLGLQIGGTIFTVLTAIYFA